MTGLLTILLVWILPVVVVGALVWMAFRTRSEE